MIGRTHRFHGYGSLRGVYQRGKTIRTPLMTLRYANRGAGRPYRVAVVVSKKVSKSAVKRNRIRRRVYEAVRADGGAITPGTDLVFTVYDEQTATIRAEKLQKTVGGLLAEVPAYPPEHRSGVV